MRLLGLLLTLFIVVSCKQLKNGVELTFTEAELREKLGKKFPKTEKIYGVVPVIIEKPEVQLIDDEERVRLGLTARVEVPFKGSYEATLKFSSGIIFDGEAKALQLTKIEVEGIQATKLPEKYEPALKILSTLLAQKYLEGHEVYRLKSEEMGDKTVRYLIKDLRIKHGELAITLGL